ncbi:peptidase A4 family-domain-containing protein [Phyllosticta citrichinensis]|uniref:Peptidase A4 family-domain-containing protein n=1 Tax=Phyllosticta citrichinensis TaxID=1130410 RepID=A0ABR1XXP7_9PEZI
MTVARRSHYENFNLSPPCTSQPPLLPSFRRPQSSATTVLAAPGLRKVQQPGIDLKSEKGASTSSSNDGIPTWSGVALKAPAGVKFTSISATVKVPSFKMVDQSQSGGFNGIVAWVGIDGMSGVSDDVLQGGVLLAVDQVGARLTIPDGKDFIVNAVEEWYPADQNQLSQQEFRIRFGHTLELRIEVVTATTGTFTIENVDTKQRLVRPLTAPGGTKSLQNSVEWIVETLTDSKTGNAVPPPDFGTLTFADCVVTASDGKTYGPGTGEIREEASQVKTSRTANSVSVRFAAAAAAAKAGNVPPPPAGKGGKTGTP